MKYNLVLSGGGTRGYAHIGVVKALLEKGIEFSAISGTSSGAIIGAFICDGFQPDDIAEILLKYEPEIGLNYTHFWENLFSFDAYAKVLKDNLRSKSFETLQKPLHVNVTNLNNGQQVIIHEGNLLDALVATAAIPVLFPPCFINGIPYGDGGLSNNLPVDPFLNSANKIIGVHANPIGNYEAGSGMIHRLDRSLHLLMRNTVLNHMNRCHLFIEPPALKLHHLFESKKTRDLIQIGYDYVMKEIDLSFTAGSDSGTE